MKFLQQLLNPTLYPHATMEMELLETHISWVVLTGDFAYKIKKPVNFGFLDFSTLEKRRFYCDEEIRLNKRLAPQIYLETVSITGPEDSPEINGRGPVLEYAVKMRQFRQQDQFDRLLASNQLSKQNILDLACVIARFHQNAQVASLDMEFGDPGHVYAPVKENIFQINKLIEKDRDRETLTQIASWSEAEFTHLQGLFVERKRLGFIRECHGDMHLRNIAKFQGVTVIFDCIEFNSNLRWIDVISEIAFIQMDLHDHNRPDFANIALNTYLQITGDYTGLRVLRYYLVYRAMVRAKVACLRLHQEGITATQHSMIINEYRHYLNLARRYTQPDQPFLLLTCGLSGSGKTFITDKLMDFIPFVRLRSDVERKRLFRIGLEESSKSKPDSGIYSPDASRQTYARLEELARQILASQWNVLVDAAFLHTQQRQMFQRLADELSIPLLILHFTAPEEILAERVVRRQRETTDASEADVTILKAQIQRQQPPSSAEQAYTMEIDAGHDDFDIAALAQTIQSRLRTQPSS